MIIISHIFCIDMTIVLVVVMAMLHVYHQLETDSVSITHRYAYNIIALYLKPLSKHSETHT